MYPVATLDSSISPMELICDACMSPSLSFDNDGVVRHRYSAADTGMNPRAQFAPVGRGEQIAFAHAIAGLYDWNSRRAGVLFQQDVDFPWCEGLLHQRTRIVELIQPQRRYKSLHWHAAKLRHRIRRDRLQGTFESQTAFACQRLVLRAHGFWIQIFRTCPHGAEV